MGRGMDQKPQVIHPHHHHHHPHNHHLQPPQVHIHGKVQRTSNLSTLSLPCSEQSAISVPLSDSSAVQKEQYWMCSKRTKLEKFLMVAVLLLTTVIIGMTIGLAVLASGDRKSSLYFFIKKVFGPLGKLHAGPYSQAAIQ